MTQNPSHVPSRSARSTLLPPAVGSNTPKWLGGGAAAVLVLALLLTFVNVVQAQVARGETFRQQWQNAGATTPAADPAADGTLKVATSPDQSDRSDPAPIRF